MRSASLLLSLAFVALLGASSALAVTDEVTTTDGQVIKGEAPVGEYDKVAVSAGGAAVLTIAAVLLFIFFPPGGFLAAALAGLAWLGVGVQFLLDRTKLSKRRRR